MSIRSKKKEASYDVIVVGGGMNGICAAIASARHGAKTALVQDRPVLGGNASSEIRMHICGASNRMLKPDAEETGILREILLENRRVNDFYNFSIWDRVLFTTVKSTPNLTLFLNTAMHEVDVEGNHVTAIHCYQLTTEIEWTLSAPVFCDCTGNGTLGFLAGASFRTGSEGKDDFNEPHAPENANKERMGNTLLFKAVDRGVPVKFIPPEGIYHFTEEQLRYRKHVDRRDIAGKAIESVANSELNALDTAAHDLVTDSYCIDYGYWWCEVTGEKEDIIEEYEDLRDELVKCIYGIWDHIKNDGDHGAENYDLAWVGMLPGMRESRRMEGLYMLNENDLISNRVFDDAVAYGGWASDNHVPLGVFDFDKLPTQVFDFDGLYTIPYRCYVSKDIDNLYISGRSMSASKLAMASSRVMGTCAVGGQAIGTAASLCKKYSCLPKDIMLHMEELQQTLLKDDCYIPGFKNEDTLDVALNAHISASSEKLPACNVTNGVSRTVGENANCWQSNGIRDGGETLNLTLKEEHTIREIRLTFDPNLNKSIRPTLSSSGIKEQGIGVPPELVKDYDILLYRQDKLVGNKQVRNNYQRHNIIEIDPTICDKIVLRVLTTNGCEDARIYEVRAYA